MDPERHFESGIEVDRYEALLQMADLVVHHGGMPELLPELAKRLQQVASFEIASFSLYDPEKKVMRMHFWEGSDRLSDQTELPVEESACGFVWERQQADGVARPAPGNPVSARGKTSHRKGSSILLHSTSHDCAKEVRGIGVGKFSPQRVRR